jgi:hypothetical protein
MADILANYLQITCELSGRDNQLNLTVTQDGFEDAADGEKRYGDVYNNGEC